MRNPQPFAQSPLQLPATERRVFRVLRHWPRHLSATHHISLSSVRAAASTFPLLSLTPGHQTKVLTITYTRRTDGGKDPGKQPGGEPAGDKPKSGK